MESQPQNPEFRNNPVNFHACKGADQTEGMCMRATKSGFQGRYGF